MTFHVAPGGAFKQVVASWISPQGSAWKRVLGRWVGVGGAWKVYAVSGNVLLVPATIRSFGDEGTLPQATLQLTPEGKVTALFNDQTVAHNVNISDWFDPETPGVGNNFEVRAVRISGVSEAMLTGDSIGPAAWHSLSALRGWTLIAPTTPTYNRTLAITLEVSLRPAGGVDPVSTAQFTLSTMVRGAGAGYFAKGGGIDVMSPNRFNA